MSQTKSKTSVPVRGLLRDGTIAQLFRRQRRRHAASRLSAEFSALERRLLLSVAGGTVWEDLNGNGLIDSGETGISGVTVKLLNGSGATVLGTTTTDSNGNYSFNVSPGTYEMQFVAPSNYLFAQEGIGSDPSLNSSADPTTGKTAAFTLASGQTDSNENAGLYQLAVIYDMVWKDLAGNGKLVLPQPMTDTTVNLLNSSGAIIATNTTDGAGSFTFLVVPGTYAMQFVLPSGYVFSPENVGSDPRWNSQVNPITGQTALFNVISGQTDDRECAGMYPGAAVGSQVWNDLNGNGLIDSGEPGVAGATVNLLSSTGQVVSSTTTDSNGSYYFDAAPGTYSVQVIPPSGYDFTTQGTGPDATQNSQADPATGRTPQFSLTSGQLDIAENAGLYQGTAIVSGEAWNDLNGNGLIDPGESGIPGVTVNLLNGTGTVVNTATTDSNGGYSFTAPVGAYSVQFIIPAGDVFSPTGVGPDRTVNSAVDPTTGETGLFTLNPGTNTENAGIYQGAAVGGLAWSDVNGNGLMDVGESGMSGVTVNLLDGTGAVVDTAATGLHGNYYLDVIPGTYSVQFVQPSDYHFTTEGVGSDPSLNSQADTSTGQTAQFTVAPGQSNESENAGLVSDSTPVMLGNGVSRVLYTDANGTDVQVYMTGGTATLHFTGTLVTSTTSRGATTVTGSGVQLAELDITSTSPWYSAVDIDTDAKGARVADVGEIAGTSALTTLYAPTTDLTGAGIDMTGAGYINNMHIGNLSAGADVVMQGAGAGTPGSGLTIQAGDIGAGSDITVAQPINTLRVVDWESGQLTAPRAGYINVAGAYAGPVGNMGAAMTLQGATDSAGYSLRTLVVAGDLTSAITAPGKVGYISAGQFSSGSLDALSVDSLYITGSRAKQLGGNLGAAITLSGAGYDLGSVYVAGDVTSNMTLSGKARSMSVDQWDAGSLNAVSIDSVSVHGGSWNMLAGNLGAAITLTGAGYDLGSLYVSGDVSSDVSASGKVRSIRAGQWDAGSLTAQSLDYISICGNWSDKLAGNLAATIDLTGTSDSSGYSLRSLYALGDITSTMTLAGKAGYIGGGRWSGGSFTGQTLDSLSLFGNYSAGISGDLDADLTLTGNNYGYSSRSIYLSGTMNGSTVTMSGSAGGLSALQMVNSQLLVGYTPTSSSDPMSGGTFTSNDTIAYVSIYGNRWSPGKVFVGSTLGAYKIGWVNLASLDTDNSGTAFGVIGHSLGGVYCASPSWRWSSSGPADQSMGECHVILI